MFSLHIFQQWSVCQQLPWVHTMCLHVTSNAEQSSVCLAQRQSASDSCLSSQSLFFFLVFSAVCSVSWALGKLTFGVFLTLILLCRYLIAPMCSGQCCDKRVILKTQNSVLGTLARVFHQVSWVILWLYAYLYLGVRTPYGLNIWPYSLINLMWTEKSGPELPVCAMLRAGGGEPQLQNSVWGGSTSCHQDSLLHGSTCISTPMLDDEALFGQWQTVYSNLTVSLHHDAARCREQPDDHWGANGLGLLTRMCSDMTRGSGFKMNESRFRFRY